MAPLTRPKGRRGGGQADKEAGVTMPPFGVQVAGLAALLLALDELLKTFARTHLAPCSVQNLAGCERLQVVGPLSLVRTGNAGSAFGFGQGWWVWLLLALVGVLLIPLYARWLARRGWVAGAGLGLQVGGALGNVLDRLALGGATDVLYAGSGPVWNLADLALVVGTLLATWALARGGARNTVIAPVGASLV
jgi:signal peptidase II